MPAIFATMVAWWNRGLPRLVFSPEVPIHAGIEALEQFNRDTRLLGPTRSWWSANPFGMLWPEMDVASVTSTMNDRERQNEDRERPRRPVHHHSSAVIIAAG